MASELPRSVSSGIWAEAALRHREALRQFPITISLETFSTLDGFLRGLVQRHKKRRSTRMFDKLTPVITHLREFGDAVGVFVQASPELAGLVWGTIKLIIQTASVYSITMERIVDMYEKMTTAMPRFTEYTNLFPSRIGLQKALLSIFDAYVEFSLCAAKFLTRSVTAHIFMNFLRVGVLVTTFDKVIAQINRATKEFKKEAGAAHIISTQYNLEHIKVLLQQQEATVSTTSPIFSVPYPRNQRFYGRKTELEQVRTSLKPSPSEQKSCVLHGMAGVGKTQTALEFAYLSQQSYTHTFWIPAEDVTVLTNAFRRISVLLGLVHDYRARDPTLFFDKILGWLRQNQSWLLVFDNAEDPDLLNNYWPACEHGAILITTQCRKMIHRTLSQVQLQSFSDAEGAELLLHHLPDTVVSSELATQLSRDISNEVKGLPLLLVGLAGHVVDSCTSLSETLQDLRQSWNRSDNTISNIDTDSAAAFQYRRPICMAFSVSIGQLPGVALSVLRIMSMLSPDGISEHLISEDLEGQYLSFLGYRDELRFRREVRSCLIARHLVEMSRADAASQPVYSLHRQLQWTLLSMLRRDDFARQQTFDQVVAIIQRNFPPLSDFMTPTFSNWSSYQSCIAHVLRLHEVYLTCNAEGFAIRSRLEFAKLLTSAGYYLYEIRVATDLGLAVLSTSASICKELCLVTNSPDLPEVIKYEASALTISWGIISNTQGLSGGRDAMKYMNRVLALREEHAKKCLAPDQRFFSQVLLSNAYNDFADQLIHMHRYEEADGFLNKSLELKKKLSDERDLPPFEVGESKNGLAYVRIGEGRIEDATRVSQEAIRVVADVDGHANDYTRFYFCHGVCLFHAGRIEDALRIMQYVHSIRASTFGKPSRDTRDSAYAVAFILYRLGKLELANEYLEGCFGHRGNNLWSGECISRAKYLRSVIFLASTPKSTAHASGSSSMAEACKKESLQELRHFLSVIYPDSRVGGDALDREGVDPFTLFDFVVPYSAGRFCGGIGSLLPPIQVT